MARLFKKLNLFLLADDDGTTFLRALRPLWALPTEHPLLHHRQQVEDLRRLDIYKQNYATAVLKAKNYAKKRAICNIC